MFAVIVGSPDVRGDIAAMGRAMRGYRGTLRTHVDEARGLALCAGAAHLLPEDALDCSPYVTETHCFVGSGRVDNRAEVAELLRVDAAAMSDVELLHHAYQRWGENCGNQLAGQYALCAVDLRTGDVTAAVDHLGTVPVLHAFVRGTHVVATQMGAMLAHPLLRGATPDVDATAMLVTGRMPRDGTAFRGIGSLLGGHTLSAKNGAAQQRRWWHPEQQVELRFSRTEEYVAHASAVFADAVRARLRSTGEVSATVSGGLDSSLVAGVAAVELQGRTLRMYTVVPEPGIACAERPGWDNDESALVRDLAALHPNALPTWVRFAGVSPLQVVRETHAHSHTPLRNTANQVWFRSICQQALAGGSRVLLTGERGNATVSVAADVAIGRLFSQRPWVAWQLARQDARDHAREGGRSALRTMAAEVRVRLRRLRKERDAPWYGEEFLSGDLLNCLRPRFEEIGDLRTRASQIRFATFPIPAFRRDETVHSAVETRDPTGDKRLIELLLSFPPEAFFAGGRPRGLAREMGAGYVPDSIRLRRRRGMQVPEHCGIIALHAEEYREAFRVLEASAACREHLQLERGRAELERLCSGVIDLRAASTIDRMIDVGLFWSEHGL